MWHQYPKFIPSHMWRKWEWWKWFPVKVVPHIRRQLLLRIGPGMTSSWEKSHNSWFSSQKTQPTTSISYWIQVYGKGSKKLRKPRKVDAIYIRVHFGGKQIWSQLTPPPSKQSDDDGTIFCCILSITIFCCRMRSGIRFVWISERCPPTAKTNPHTDCGKSVDHTF